MIGCCLSLHVVVRVGGLCFIVFYCNVLCCVVLCHIVVIYACCVVIRCTVVVGVVVCCRMFT